MYRDTALALSCMEWMLAPSIPSDLRAGSRHMGMLLLIVLAMLLFSFGGYLIYYLLFGYGRF
jgi:hypothetical protein